MILDMLFYFQEITICVGIRIIFLSTSEGDAIYIINRIVAEYVIEDGFWRIHFPPTRRIVTNSLDFQKVRKVSS